MPNLSKRPQRHTIFACLWTALVAGGCSTHDRVEVSGRITYLGEPVTNVFVKFTTDQGVAGFAGPDQQGVFRVNTSGTETGIVPGTYKVSVQYRPLEPDPNLPAPPPPPVYVEVIRERFSQDKTELEIEIDGPRPDLHLRLD